MVARLALTVAAVALVAATGCSEYSPKTPGPTDGSKLDFAPHATITVDDTGLHPTVVKPGAAPVAVEVVNRGTRPDGIASGPINGDDAQRADTGSMQPGESSTVFLTGPGTVDVHSRADPSHTGMIDVEGTR